MKKLMLKSRKRRGFTITEVLIVLAIAGSIMSIVFYAVPQLQRSQRDNSRKNLAGRLLSSIETYASNNQGVYPFSGPGGTGTDPNLTNGVPNCKTLISGSSSQTCYDWYSNYAANGKINLQDPSCGSDISIIYGPLTANLPYSSWTCGGSSYQPGEALISLGAQCSGSSLAAGPSAGTHLSKQFALQIALEKSGSYFCIDNR